MGGWNEDWLAIMDGLNRNMILKLWTCLSLLQFATAMWLP
mgnify:CR=1 FL=1